jgi:predicted RNA binding protein YcfA (HicA-like mRNA interferase family)
MKLPRDLSATGLIKALAMYGYAVTRQKGSHIRLATRHSRMRTGGGGDHATRSQNDEG